MAAGAAASIDAVWKPVRVASLESDVAVPAAQTFISALVGGLVASLGGGMAGLHPLTPGLVGAAAVGAITWYVLLNEHRASLWELSGSPAQQSEDKDEQVKRQYKPEVRVEIVERDASSGGVKRMRWLDLPIDDENLPALARYLTRNGILSRRAVADFVRPEQYQELIDVLLNAGLARLRGNDPRAGVELTPSGRAMFRSVVEAGGGGGRTL